jgi:hypothetical protein
MIRESRKAKKKPIMYKTAEKQKMRSALFRLNGHEPVFQIDVDRFDFRLSPEGFFNSGRAEAADHSIDGGPDCVGRNRCRQAEDNDDCG